MFSASVCLDFNVRGMKNVYVNKAHDSVYQVTLLKTVYIIILAYFVSCNSVSSFNSLDHSPSATTSLAHFTISDSVSILDAC